MTSGKLQKGICCLVVAGSKESYTLTSALQRYAEFSVTPRKFCPYVHRRAMVTRFGPARDIAGKETSCLLFYLTGWLSCLITRWNQTAIQAVWFQQDSSLLHLPKGGRRDGEGACVDWGEPPNAFPWCPPQNSPSPHRLIIPLRSGSQEEKFQLSIQVKLQAVFC